MDELPSLPIAILHSIIENLYLFNPFTSQQSLNVIQLYKVLQSVTLLIAALTNPVKTVICLAECFPLAALTV